MSKPIVRTLGGDRVGSGNRMKQEMHNFYRSNKNLSKTWASTMAPGVLYPAYVNWALKGDTFDIDMNAFVRTVPTIGPLYGSFKLQLDFYQVPVRLYQGILHNNTTDIARKMNQVYFPQVEIGTNVEYDTTNDKWVEQISTSALVRYLNIKGISTTNDTSGEKQFVSREFNAVPMLAYYDIFKNYYANKQEENAYVIGHTFKTIKQKITDIHFGPVAPDMNWNTFPSSITSQAYTFTTLPTNWQIKGENLDLNKIFIRITRGGTTTYENSIQYFINNNKLILDYIESGSLKGVYYFVMNFGTIMPPTGDITLNINYTPSWQEFDKIDLQAFPLTNIDDMRKYLLTRWDLGQKTIISNLNQYYLPYSTITGNREDGYTFNKYPMNGLVVKCYQSDLFNNWLDTEWVNEITSASAVNIVDGSFTIDALNFKKKLYDHLNRLAISGGTYDDWQTATYGEEVWGKSEKPIYCGGMSSEVVFDEVVSTAATGEDPLGTIGGRGTLNGKKGGKITIKVGEASVIMAIVSLTPRLFYTQGNAWYNTELETMDDLHKPIFDRIGFQDLMVEQMAWFDTWYDADEDKFARHSAGKQPAWINYATDVDEAYGDFAKEEGVNYMILARNYECKNGNVNDVTTYIDPAKYSYAFAYSEIDAQNFWTFINYKIHARRKMSNTQIPNV